MDEEVQEIIAYIHKYRKEGFRDEEIRTALIKSKVSSSLIDEGFTLSKNTHRSLTWAFLCIGLGILLLLILLFFFLNGSSSSSSSDCSEEQDCPQGAFCSQGTCVEQIGMLNCQIEENCDNGYSCYKCIEEISS